jgi:hypothetical protein
MMTRAQQALLTAHRECISTIREALTGKDIAQGVNNSANTMSSPPVPPVVNDNVKDVQGQNNIINVPIQQRHVSLRTNKGHEVNMNEQDDSHEPDATTVNMEGQDEETIAQGMAQPVHSAMDYNDIQHQVNTVQGTPEPAEAPEPPLQAPCKWHLFSTFL